VHSRLTFRGALAVAALAAGMTVLAEDPAAAAGKVHARVVTAAHVRPCHRGHACRSFGPKRTARHGREISVTEPTEPTLTEPK
jgi:hypothetical protein